MFRLLKNPKDYCTLFFDKINDYDISGCCLIHDQEYRDPNVSRYKSDRNLRLCVNNVSHSRIGDFMYLGVRIFGWIFWYWHRLKNRK